MAQVVDLDTRYSTYQVIFSDIDPGVATVKHVATKRRGYPTGQQFTLKDCHLGYHPNDPTGAQGVCFKGHSRRGPFSTSPIQFGGGA